jgi:quinol-cytochrome oxidoreductase complex cytochrome b subunit
MTTTPNRTRRQFFSGFLLHLHPRRVPEETIRFTLSFGLGGMSATLIFLLFLTGIFQALAYIPDVKEAYTSVQGMYEPGTFSGWVRNIHYWSGNLLVIVAFLHCCRVFLTGAISGGRRRNWFIGLILLNLVFFANFSGYLLPWDQLAFWAVTIFTNMIGYIPFIGEGVVQLLRGGSEIGPSTLTNFYSIHTGILPFCLIIIVIYHFWLIRKAGGLVQKENLKSTHSASVSVMPNLIVREIAVGLTLVAAVMLFAALVDAPLDEAANPGMSPNPAKAAWFFLGLQELLMHLHPTFAICVLPLFVLFCLVFLPYWRNGLLPEGQWFGGKRGMKLAFWTCLGSIALTFATVIIDERIKTAGESVATDGVARGVLPIVGLVLLYCTGHLVFTRKFKFTQAEAVMAGFVFSITTMISLTVIGIWFRGPGMQLIFPS